MTEIVAIVDPRTGEQLELAGATTDVIVELVEVLRAHERQEADWRRAGEDEVMRRMDEKGLRRFQLNVAGRRVELTIDTKASRSWDVDDLELVLDDLVARGVLKRQQVEGVISRSKPTVDGKRAAALLSSLQRGSEAARALESCFKWERRGRRALKVDEVPDLDSQLEAQQRALNE